MGEVRVGISGWRYAGWRKKFYPEDLPQKRELEYASEVATVVAQDDLAKPFVDGPQDLAFTVFGVAVASGSAETHTWSFGAHST